LKPSITDPKTLGPWIINDKPFTSEMVADAAGCLQSTLRQWRNRNGLLNETVTGGKETKRYSVLDACVVRAVVLLARYMSASHAIWFVGGIVSKQIKRLLENKPNTSSKIGFYLPESGGDPVFSSDPGDRAEDLLANTEGVIVLVDLKAAVIDHVVKALKLERPKP
jgi:DNA-binding transcriptional MerR regulator